MSMRAGCVGPWVETHAYLRGVPTGRRASLAPGPVGTDDGRRGLQSTALGRRGTQPTVRMLALVLAVAMLPLPGTAPAMAQENGLIEGVVRNGTAGAAPPADVEVVVHILQNRVKTGERRVRTDASGRFRVDGLTTGADLLYFPI